ncbi:hypothetical protein MACK_002853 [Theileria orientalis]|uniref:Uncharacterized protein n=1 Tax=Theileria orientalis TaxID=68886 RepID=A0A976QVA3_THEOR|nr:hypothetical protein MACK_002853 [Theileria orientalis]
MDFTSFEYMSFIRIYNLDKGLEEPLYELELSERLCRLGQISGSDINYKFQKIRGRVVDIFMNSNDKSSLGSFTLFALSNYGYMFCYCPIIINSIYDFNRNTPLIKKCLELRKKGFQTKFGKQVGNKSNTPIEDGYPESDQIKDFISNINKYLIVRQTELEFYPVVIRLLSNDFIPDCNLIYSYPVFESFIVLSTDPLIIIVSQSDSKISVYRPKLDLYPSTSSFYNPSLMNALHVCVHSQYIDFGTNDIHCFKQLSQSDFLYYSMNAVYHFNYKQTLTYVPLFDLKHSSKCLYSDPVIIKTSIGTITNNDIKINKDNLSENVDINSHLSLLKNVSTIILTHEINRTDSKNNEHMSSILMNKFDQSDSTDSSQKINNSYPSSLTMTSVSYTPQEKAPVINPNTELFSKINNSKTLVNGYKDIFKSLKLSNDKDDLNEKSVEMIKALAKLDSDVIKNLESLPVYEKAVSEYVAMSNEASGLIDDFFNETIDHYHTIFNHVKARIDKIKERRKLMSARHSEIMKTLLLYNSVKNVDDTVDQVSNMISEFHLRYSNIILSKFDEHINTYIYFPPNLLNKQLEIDQWFYNTYKNNVDLMYKIHSRIKTIRTSMDTMA